MYTSVLACANPKAVLAAVLVSVICMKIVVTKGKNINMLCIKL